MVLALVAFMSLLTAAYFAVDNHVQTERFHTASLQKQNEIIELQKEIKALATQYASGVATLTKDGALVFAQNAAICATLHISPCPGAP